MEDSRFLARQRVRTAHVSTFLKCNLPKFLAMLPKSTCKHLWWWLCDKKKENVYDGLGTWLFWSKYL